MIDWLLQLDTTLFFSINFGWACGFFDWLMPIITNSRGAILLIAALVLLAIFGGKKGRIVAVFALIAVALTDPVVVRIMKPIIDRVRPCNDLPVRLLVRCRNTRSFPSAHAANIFAYTMAIIYNYKKTIYLLLPLAMMVALSRVYVGVHYPLDITVGALMGCFFGLLSGYIAKVIYSKMEKNDLSDNCSS